MTLELKAKCTTCQKVFTMTDEQMAEARSLGCAFSPCCRAVATIEHASVHVASTRSILRRRTKK